MSLITWSVTTFTAAILAWQAATPAAAPRPTGPSAGPTVASEGFLARVEREVTTPLSRRARERTLMSRAHRPEPRLRTVADAARDNDVYAYFRVLQTTWRGADERPLYDVRVARATGAIELVSPLAPMAGGEPAWRRLADVLPKESLGGLVLPE